MSLTDMTFTRAQLQDLPDKRRRDAIRSTMQNLRAGVISAATFGKMFHMVDLREFAKMRATIHPQSTHYILTDDDLIEGFKATFPDCKVEYTEMWEDVRPGVREQKKGILVDWS